MYYRSRRELKRELGGQPLFSKLPSTPAVLRYQNGIRDYDTSNSGTEREKTFSLQQYRKGFECKDLTGKHHFGFRFEDVQFLNITPGGEYYDLVVKTRLSRPVHFIFNKSDRGKIIPFFRNIPVQEENIDPRDEDTIRREILQLRDEFVAERFSTGEFSKAFYNSAASSLNINAERVQWGKNVIPLNEITGFSMGVSLFSSHGVDRYDYAINLHRADKPFFIRFSSTDMFTKTGEFEKDMHKIREVLFDLVSRPIVAGWLERFAENGKIEYSEFTLNREGLLLKSKKPNVMIYWDELLANDFSIFRWRYTNTVFIQLPIDQDRRSNMLFYFINWLNTEAGRCETLVGRLH